jgi:hypothetical protein
MMQRDEVRRWIESRRMVDEFDRCHAHSAPDPARCWQQSLSLIALVGEMIGWPVPPDDIRRRDDEIAAVAWRKLRAAVDHRP